MTIANGTEEPNLHPRPNESDIQPGAASAIQRHAYRAPASARLGGIAGTTLIALLGAIGCLFTWTQLTPASRPSAPLVVNLLPPASPPSPPKPTEAKPKARPQAKEPPLPPKIPPAPHVLMPSPTPSPAPVIAPSDPNPVAQPVVPTPPKTAPAPPATQPANNARDSWEGRVLARIAKYRRYPGSARGAHEQGVAFIHFRMNRAGHVLYASLARSSGYPDLDQAALDTLRSADPLPSIPADRPDEMELSVPIEFYIR